MSDLRHQTPDELRRRITRDEAYRTEQMASAERFEAEAADLMDRAKACRQRYHNVGQRVVWARKYLAEKELAR